MAKRTVLIVDDELTLLRSLRDALRAQESAEMEVLTAGRADEALELMELAEVDLVVSDLRMPGLDGLSFISTVTQKYPKTRCILMTAHGDTETRNKSMANGAVSFLEKPFDLDKFLSEVNRHLSPSGFTGRGLVGFSLLDILQLVSMSQQSVTMTIRSGSSVGSMYIEDGVLIHAETDGGKTGSKAAYEIVTWSDGDIASSRGVASDCKRTISIPLMTFLMEAAKHQDEAKRLKPVEDVKNIVSSLLEVAGVSAVSTLLVQTGAEIYGVSENEELPRADICHGMAGAFKALKDSLAQGAAQMAPPEALSARFGEGTALAIPVNEGRFITVLYTSDPGAAAQAEEAFMGHRGNLATALSEYETQFDLSENSDFDSLSFGDELDQALGGGDGL